MSWHLVFTGQARKDAEKVSAAGLRERVECLLNLLRQYPFQQTPPFEKLTGDLKGACSRRINIQRRLVYQLLPETKMIKIIRLWA